MEKLEVSDNTTLVRLIGDEFADRGNNDYFTLRLLNFLHENGVRVHTTISNHSNEFISAYESKDFNSSGLIKPDQQTSFLALKSLVNRGLISKEEINVLIERSYKPTLKVVDYTLDEKGITLFTHAPVDFMLIKKIADKLGVNYSDATKESLATTIDEINKAFGDVVAEHRVHELCNKQEISEPKNMTNEEMTDMPLMCIIWNRWNATKDTEMARPATINGYSCTYVHGHDDYSSQFENIINLDTSCGKEPRLKEKERIDDATRVLTNEPHSPDVVNATKYLDSLQEKIFVSNDHALKPDLSFIERFRSFKDAVLTKDDPDIDPTSKRP